MKALVLSLTLLSTSWLSAKEAAVVEFLAEPKDAERDREVPLRIYLVEDGESKPVVLFSHGLGGSRDNNAFLGRAWAEAGYVAVFMQHRGSDQDVWASTPIGQRMVALKQAASARSAIQRLEDVPFVIDQLEEWQATEGHPLHGRLDLERIGMSGHSFGGSTTQGVMGQKYPGDRQAEEPRLKAFLILSPSVSRLQPPEQSFGHIEKPVLCMTGTEDGNPIDPTMTPESRTEVYAALPEGTAFQLLLDQAGHHAFGSAPGPGKRRMPHHHPAIVQISTMFWDAYLKEDPAAVKWLQSDQPQALLKEADVWEWK